MLGVNAWLWLALLAFTAALLIALARSPLPIT
jgi:hypothetical protein